MTRLVWDAVGERRFETGVDRGVLYDSSGRGVPWNGLTSVQESPTGGTVDSYWIDGRKYLDIIENDDYQATLEAFTYPEEFEKCMGVVPSGAFLKGSQQRKERFSFSYRTLLGNDVQGVDLGYKIHLVYNALASPTQKSYQTQGSDVSPLTLSWQIDTVPVDIPGLRPSAHITLDSTDFDDPDMLAVFESILYGSPGTSSRLISPTTIANIIAYWGQLMILDNGDGTWSAIGPEADVFMTSDDAFQVNNAGSSYIDAGTYVIPTTF